MLDHKTNSNLSTAAPPSPVQYIIFTAEVQIAQATKLKNALTAASNAGHEIYLLLSSTGGSVVEGLAIATLMRALPVKITTHNLGQIDSIAAVIFSAGTTRYAVPGASFLFHGVSMYYERADFTEIQLYEQYQRVRRLRENVSWAFANYVGMAASDVEALMLNGPNVINEQEALHKAIIHEVRHPTIHAGAQIVSIGNG